MPNRKLNRPSDQRKAILRSLTTALIWNGKIVTTEARAKEVRSIAEKLITLASKEYKNSVEVKKTVKDASGNEATITTKNDLPSKLHARRQIMAWLYDVQEPKKAKESKGDYHLRTRKINHPVVEKLFNEYGPKYENRNGGYTRIVKMGPRRGDAAEMCLIELV